MSSIILKLVKSVVKISILSGIKYQELSKELKKAFINEASEELESLSEKVNSSRLSVITGLQRREIDSILSAVVETNTLSTRMSLISKVVGQWQFHPNYSKAPSKPKSLTFIGVDSEFSSLIKSISSDLHAGTILFELERLNLVEKSKEKIKLKSKVSKFSSLEESLVLLSNDIETLTSAVIDNIKSSKEKIEKIPNLHATTEFNKISKSEEVEIRSWLLKEGSSFHKKIRNYLASKDLDIRGIKAKESSCIKVSVGTFSLISNDSKKNIKK